MLHPKFRRNRPTGSGEDVEGLNHIWAWRPSWSWDLDIVNNVSILLPNDAPHKISLFGQAVSGKKIFEIMNDGRTMKTDGRLTGTGAWPSRGHKLTLRAFPTGTL